jgi:hypothetical protein
MKIPIIDASDPSGKTLYNELLPLIHQKSGELSLEYTEIKDIRAVEVDPVSYLNALYSGIQAFATLVAALHILLVHRDDQIPEKREKVSKIIIKMKKPAVNIEIPVHSSDEEIHLKIETIDLKMVIQIIITK